MNLAGSSTSCGRKLLELDGEFVEPPDGEFVDPIGGELVQLVGGLSVAFGFSSRLRTSGLVKLSHCIAIVL
jgi:hypothetical protein